MHVLSTHVFPLTPEIYQGEILCCCCGGTPSQPNFHLDGGLFAFAAPDLLPYGLKEKAPTSISWETWEVEHPHSSTSCFLLILRSSHHEFHVLILWSVGLTRIHEYAEPFFFAVFRPSFLGINTKHLQVGTSNQRSIVMSSERCHLRRKTGKKNSGLNRSWTVFSLKNGGDWKTIYTFLLGGLFRKLFRGELSVKLREGNYCRYLFGEVTYRNPPCFTLIIGG